MVEPVERSAAASVPAELRIVISKLPADITSDRLGFFMRAAFQNFFKDADTITCVEVLNAEGASNAPKAATIAFKHHIAATAMMSFDGIEFEGVELDVDRPDDYITPESGDPADRMDICLPHPTLDGVTITDILWTFPNGQA